MAKRFIDTGIFDDDWFMELSKDSKLLWLYFITKCNHAGIIKLNEKLCKLQTEIKDIPETIKLLGNRIITVNEHLYFIPKFIEYQYPGFPNSKVRQQASALDILTKYNLWDGEKINSLVTLNKELTNSYVNVNGNDNVPVLSKREKNIEFYKNEYLKSDNETYKGFVDWLLGKNDVERPLNYVLSLDDQIGSERFGQLILISEEHGTKILDKVRSLENTKSKKYSSFNLTLTNWLKNKF